MTWGFFQVELRRKSHRTRRQETPNLNLTQTPDTPDRRRPALRQSATVVMLVRCVVGWGLRCAHASQLPRWIH